MIYLIEYKNMTNAIACLNPFWKFHRPTPNSISISIEYARISFLSFSATYIKIICKKAITEKSIGYGK
jgi:hypothetical protein